MQIPLHGSRLLRASALFAAADLAQAGHKGYILITDRTCRLFGYHGVLGNAGAVLFGSHVRFLSGLSLPVIQSNEPGFCLTG